MKGCWGHFTRKPCEQTRTKRIVLVWKSGLPFQTALCLQLADPEVLCLLLSEAVSPRPCGGCGGWGRFRWGLGVGSWLSDWGRGTGRMKVGIEKGDDSRWFPNFISSHEFPRLPWNGRTQHRPIFLDIPTYPWGCNAQIVLGSTCSRSHFSARNVSPKRQSARQVLQRAAGPSTAKHWMCLMMQLPSCCQMPDCWLHR